MKKSVCLILVFFAILIIACNNQKKSKIENPYVGAWQQVDIKYVLPDNTYVNVTSNPDNVKIITNKHYAFGYPTSNGGVWAGGGEYTFSGNTFTSFPKYHSKAGTAGGSIVWNSKIEADLWMISQDRKTLRQNEKDTLQIDTIEYKIIETWKRIPE